MKTKHRYEFRTFTVEKENGWVTITDEESGVAVRGAEDKSREDFQCILPHVGYLSNENRVSYTRSILRKLEEFGNVRFFKGCSRSASQLINPFWWEKKDKT